MSAAPQLPSPAPPAFLEIPADIAAMPLLGCHVLAANARNLLMTLLFGEPGSNNPVTDSMRSLVWHIGPEGQSEIWQPGRAYPGSSIWFAEPETGILLGNDFHQPQAMYACQLDGTHIASFTLPLLWDNPIRPWRFTATPQGIEYMDSANNLCRVENIATLSTQVHGTTASARLAADWLPRPLLLPANYPGTGDILFRLTRDDNRLRLVVLQRGDSFGAVPGSSS